MEETLLDELALALPVVIFPPGLLIPLPPIGEIVVMVTEDEEVVEAGKAGKEGEVVVSSLPTALAGMAEPTPLLV